MQPPTDTVIPAEHQGVLILARLIPCCQHFVEPKERAKKKSWHHRQAELKDLLRQQQATPAADRPPAESTQQPHVEPSAAPPVSSFELSVDALALQHQINPERRLAFVRHLLSSPCNVALRATYLHLDSDGRNWPAALGAAIADRSTAVVHPSERTVSWELLLCLMRNVLCHEHCFEFSNVRAMWAEALRCFGSRAVIEQVIQLYSDFVVQRSAATLSVYKQHFPPERDLHWRDLLLCLQLIVCRCNNAIVDARFEAEMEDLTERDLGVADDEWTAFALYLLSHPANPDQNGTSPDQVTWLMAMRLMRNVVCHERSFAFAFTAELFGVALRLFRTAENVGRVLALYRECCFTSLSSMLASEFIAPSEHSGRHRPLLRILPVASIQLQNPSSCALLLSSHLRIAQIVLGADTLCRWAKTSKETSKSACVTLLVGDRGSGRSTAALFIAALMSCAAGVPTFGTARRRRSGGAPELRISSGPIVFVQLAQASTEWSKLAIGERIAELERRIAAAAVEQLRAPLNELCRRTHGDAHVVVVCDDIDRLFCASDTPEHIQALRTALAALFSRYAPADTDTRTADLHFVLTCGTAFSDAALRTDWPFIRSFPLNALAARDTLVDDAQLLLRHYYRIDKWYLRSLYSPPMSAIALMGQVSRAAAARPAAAKD